MEVISFLDLSCGNPNFFLMSSPTLWPNLAMASCGSSPIHLPHKTEKEKEKTLLFMKENRKNKVQKNYYVYRLSYRFLLRASPAVFSMIGGGLGTKSKPPGPIIIMGQLKTLEQQSYHIYYTLFWRCTSQPPQIIQSQNNFPFLDETGMFCLFFIQFCLCRTTY